jgi:hypothetical protein
VLPLHYEAETREGEITGTGRDVNQILARPESGDRRPERIETNEIGRRKAGRKKGWGDKVTGGSKAPEGWGRVCGATRRGRMKNEK